MPILDVTYYLTSSTCMTVNPGSGVLLSARINDNFARVTFSPATAVVSSSVTTGAGCTGEFPPVIGPGSNEVSYKFGDTVGVATICTISITLTDGGSLSFVATNDTDTLANSFTSVNLESAPQPSWTLTAAPSPTSFTAAGQVITYTYTLTNTGNRAINSISVTGAKTGTANCGALAVGASTTCTSTYTTIAADLGAPISYTATATGTPTGGTLANAVASGTIAFTPQPGLMIATTPSPTTFNSAGQTIAYSHTITNSGNVAVNSIAVTGTKTGTISCPTTTLAIGASATCTSGYTTVAADVGVGVTYSATVSGTAAGGGTVTATANGTIVFNPQPSLAVAVTASPTTYSNAGQVITYSYKVTNTGNVSISSITVGDSRVSTVTCPVTTLAAGANTTCSGSYTTVAADVMAGSISSTATAKGVFGSTAVASTPITTTLQLDVNAVRQATQSAIRNFMNRRAEIITSVSPDESRMHQRLSGWLFGGSNDEEAPQQQANASTARGTAVGTPAAEDTVARSRSGRGQVVARDGGFGRMTGMGMAPFSLNGSTDDEGGGRFAFATSLAQMRQAAESKSSEAPMGLGALPHAPADRKASNSGLDIWAEGVVSYYSDKAIGTKQQGHAALLFVGVDYPIHPGILVGALVQLDWLNERTPLGISASGEGWMAGPYVSARLTRNLFFDARAAWGRADNQIDPLGIYTDDFSTERSRLSAKLTGKWLFGQLQFRPSAEVVYFHETQKAYINQINILIPEQSVSLGRVIAGPEIGYRFRERDGTTFEPYVGVKGIWDFEKTADMSVDGIAVGNDPFRAMLELGATYVAPSGVYLRASVAYDGIGNNDFHAYYGRGSLTVPLN